jgi:hypothetical protein
MMRSALLVLVALGASGCIEIEGGAVELSWSLRDFDGDAVDACSDARVEQVEVCWQPTGGDTPSIDIACRPGQRESFPCSEENGVSGFTIEPGPTAFWAHPICETGEPATEDTFQAPAPIVRTVEDGQIVTLNSLLIVVSPIDEGCPEAGCTCSR